MNELRLYLDRLDTPVGELVILSDDDGRLRVVHFTDRWEDYLARRYGSKVKLSTEKNAHGFTSVFADYFDGDCAALDQLRVATSGTAFQSKVWDSLRAIPAGETWSYSRLAGYVGRSKAVRAVGAANGANPICIVLPCHRVIGADGSLTGYGGGLPRKQWLLEHERRYFERNNAAPEFALSFSAGPSGR